MWNSENGLLLGIAKKVKDILDKWLNDEKLNDSEFLILNEFMRIYMEETK